jgi:hypothetical protein
MIIFPALDGMLPNADVIIQQTDEKIPVATDRLMPA